MGIDKSVKKFDLTTDFYIWDRFIVEDILKYKYGSKLLSPQ